MPVERPVIGLNPPFGHLGDNAMAFVKKALSYGPRLLVLIVPGAVRRSMEKELLVAAHSTDDRRTGPSNRYHLLYEDKAVCSGRSFYIPGTQPAASTLQRGSEGV